MDHATMFSHRHSLNGREAAAHLQRWTSEHYTSSAQLLRGDAHWRSPPTRSIDMSVFISICTDILSNSRKNCSQVSSWKMKKKIVFSCYSVAN